MNEQWMNFTLKIRTTIYILGVLTILFASITSCEKKESYSFNKLATNGHKNSGSYFWPPDMIPHPILPGEGTKKESDGLS